MITITTESTTIEVKSILINPTDHYMTLLFSSRATARQLRRALKDSGVDTASLSLYGVVFMLYDLTYFEHRNYKDCLSVSFHFKEKR